MKPNIKKEPCWARYAPIALYKPFCPNSLSCLSARPSRGAKFRGTYLFFYLFSTESICPERLNTGS